MQTLIELYDDRPLENVLSMEMFCPERVVYISADGIGPDRHMQQKLKAYFRHRGFEPELVFLRCNVYDTEAVLKRLREVVQKYPDCCVDITGGTDAVLFAAGLLAAETELPVVTYSRKKNCYYNIRNAPFAEKLPCNVLYNVEDCFLMAGGSMRPGRVDNSVLADYLPDMDPFFRVFLNHRREWVKIVTYLQRVSQCPAEGPVSLEVRGAYQVKGERSARIEAPEAALRDLEEIGFIQNLQLEKDQYVSFSFRDGQIRTWLRDVGSVLELYVYKACLDSGLFQEVRTSAVVDWEGDHRSNAVSNEVDVMCTRGVTPVFISCKTCEVKTEALNELAILRDRFGGRIARAAIVTAEKGGAAMRNRASELGILVIDLNDLTAGRIGARLKTLMK